MKHVTAYKNLDCSVFVKFYLKIYQYKNRLLKFMCKMCMYLLCGINVKNDNQLGIWRHKNPQLDERIPKNQIPSEPKRQKRKYLNNQKYMKF